MKTFLPFIIALFFISGTLFAQQFENGSFDEWEDVGLGVDNMEPVNWSSIKTSDLDLINQNAPIVWSISDEAHSGDHSLYLINISTFGIVATGTITNGRVHGDFDPDKGYVFTDINDSRWNSPLTMRPDSVVGWYKCNPAEGDFATIKVALHTGDLQLPGDEANIVAIAYLELPSIVQDSWKRFSMAFEYFQSGAPEYYLSVITGGNGVNAVEGSEIWYDDLEFIYNPESVDENLLEDVLVYSSNGKINVSLKVQNSEFKIMVSDIMGRQVYVGNIVSGENLQIPTGISKGVFIVSFQNGSKRSSTKVIVE